MSFTAFEFLVIRFLLLAGGVGITLAGLIGLAWIAWICIANRPTRLQQ